MNEQKKIQLSQVRLESSHKKSNTRKYLPFVILWVLFFAMVFWEVAFKTELRLMDIITTVISIVILSKNKIPSKKYIITSIIFTILSVVAYLGFTRDPFLLLINGLMAGVPTLLTSLAVFSVMQSHGGYQMVSKVKKYPLLKTIIIGVIAGVILSIINTFMGMLGGREIALEFSLSKLLICFNPAMYEEMAGRSIFMAYCIYYAGNKKMNRFQLLTMYFMMSMPHALAHGYDIVATIILWLLFGLPLTILQRKKDIASAMISHGLIDAVRFTLFGI